MKSKKQLWEICVEIYQKMYLEAEPTANFKKLLNEKKTMKLDWYMDYYLAEVRQLEIIERIIKKNNLTKREKSQINKEIILGCAPNLIRK